MLMNIFDLLSTYFSYPFVRNAMIAGVLISLCSSLLGVCLVLKRYSMIGDGLSHVAFGAMSISAVLHVAPLYITLPVTILVAVIILGIGNKSLIKGDAVIAMMSVGSLSVGYLLLNVFSASSNVSGDVCTTLFGSISILTLKSSDVWSCVLLAVLVILVFVFFYHKIFTVSFDEDFSTATGTSARKYNLMLAVICAVVIVLAMKLVGALMVSALIIFPAIGSMRVFKSFLSVIISSAVISVICSVSGIILSLIYETPVGATIVVVNIICFMLLSLTGLLAKKKGSKVK